MSHMKKCSICNRIAEFKCGGCLNIGRYQWYCSREHQNKDWKNHQKDCMPIEIKENEKLGKHMIATRDIVKGDIILREPPLFIAPQMETTPLCLSCYELIDGSARCKHCRWPMCGRPKCKKTVQHKAECKYTKRNGIVRNIKDFDEVDSMYEYIAPLRCLFTRESDKEKYEKIRKMKARTEMRKEKGQVEVAKDLKKYFKLDDFTIEEVMHACGVSEVNHFKFYRKSRKIGVYHIASLLTHSCVPNTFTSFTTTDEIVIKASHDIKKGEVLYVSYCYLYFPTQIRQSSLKQMRYFTCDCRRCKDPSELNTYMGCVLCQYCTTGYVFPPLGEQAEWLCQKCGKVMNKLQVDSMTYKIEREIHNITNIDQCERLLSNTANILTEFHYLRISARLTMCALLVRNKTKSVSRMCRIKDENEMKDKYEMTYRLVEVSDTIDFKGYSMFRGAILNLLQGTMLWLYQYSKLKGDKYRECIRLKELRKNSVTVRSILLPCSMSLWERKACEVNTLIQEMLEKVTDPKSD